MKLVVSRLRAFKASFDKFSENVNWIVFGLIMVFSPCSWLNINGILSEMPNMIGNLPESWRVPSYITLLIQIAQIVALIYLFVRWLFPTYVTHGRFIYLVSITNCITCFLLAIFWKETLVIFGETRSFGLYILGFISATLTGFSTLSFLPYITSKFPKEYIFAYYIGESFSALIPGVLALIQGVSVNSECKASTILTNYTTNGLTSSILETKLTPVKLLPSFSVLIYFVVIFMFTCLSTAVFVVIDCLPYVKKFHRKSTKEEENGETIQGRSKEKAYLLFLNFLVTFFFFGFLPGIQSFSTMPYGNMVFSLSINLTYVSLPLAVFLSIWSYNISITRISMELLVTLILTVYIIIVSSLSPCPFFVEAFFGKFITVLVWFVCFIIYIRVRLVIATQLEKFGGNVFVELGFVSLLGQVLGGITIFLLVDTFRLFTETPECVFDYSYCHA